MVKRVLALAFLVVLVPVRFRAQDTSDDTWRFAVSGDSRNCGDVVMPGLQKAFLSTRSSFTGILATFGWDTVSTTT
jgi:hypothetical protein